MNFSAPKDAGDYSLTLYLMCDSYLGCDQEYAVPLTVLVGEEEGDMEEWVSEWVRVGVSTIKLVLVIVSQWNWVME